MITRPFLLTGGSGVVGTALREFCDPQEYIALVRNRPLSGPTTVRGDIRADRLGLPRGDYDAIARRVGAIVHATADTQLNATLDDLTATNLVCTSNVLAFAEHADVPVHYASTAYIHCLQRPENVGRSLPYAESKRAAERLVITSGVALTILRPSIVVGDSSNGLISNFQGLHQMCGATLDDIFPVWPAAPNGMVDFVPQDLVARIIAAAVRDELASAHRDIWITAGTQALTLDQLIDLLERIANDTGRRMRRPRMISRDTYDRLIKRFSCNHFRRTCARSSMPRSSTSPPTSPYASSQRSLSRSWPSTCCCGTSC
jgi:nucleoside-diphosphate-sugar epimerase